jgi:ATP-dependent Lhr-like helicase
MLNNWYEPPATHEYAMSTLIQQILSVIAEVGSIKAISLLKLLCQSGPFSLVSSKIFAQILRSLGENDLITQMRDGDLTLGLTGEKVVSKFSFYSSFKVQEEYTIDFNGSTIGTVPLNQPLSLGDSFLFAGKGWQVIFFNSEKRQISVKPYKEKANPIIMDGRPSRIHDGVREKMFELYCGTEIPSYLNKTAAKHFIEGREMFKELGLKDNRYVMGLDGLYIFPWKGDKIMNTIVQILKHYKIQAKKIDSYILLPGLSTITYKQIVKTILESPKLNEEEMASKISNLEYDKYDKYLSKELKCIQYGYRNFDIDGAMKFFEEALVVKTPFNPKNNAAYNICSDIPMNR